MPLFEFEIATKKSEELIDITDAVSDIVARAKVDAGLVHVFIPHATAAVILNESADPNIKTDFLNAIEKAIPRRAGYLHDRVDQNAAAHIRSALAGPSVLIPLHGGRLALGTWQAIMFCEFDGPRHGRRVIVQVLAGK